MRRTRLKRTLWTLVLALLASLGVAILVIFSGVYNVGASSGEGSLLGWILSTTMERSVREHASGIVSPDLGDSALIDLGYDHYKEMCVSCHGSPAGGRSEAGVGLDPPAPELSHAARDWTAGELYWILKNGVKMTGMPAFGPTHSERELWGMVAFLRKLEGMSPEAYAAFDSLRTVQDQYHAGVNDQ
jgi:mono/diheme cytochrome c family protein